MDQYYISSSDVILSLNQQKMDVPAGYLESDQTRHLTRLIGNFRSIEELENIIVRSNFSGKKIRIKDIAVVKDGSEKEIEKEYIYSSHSGKDFKLHPSVSISVFKTLKADIINLAENVNKQVDKFKSSLNAPYEIITGFDESKNTKNRLMSVINNALIGLLLIFLVFFIFLPSRLGFLASFSLPLSILGSFCFLPFMGISFNVITMLAFVICIGMLVDNSVVIAEYYTRLTVDYKISPEKSALQVVEQFFKPITATVLTTIVAFLPMLITTGVMGQFIKWIPIVVSFVLLVSLFESFCLLPNRLQWLIQKKPGRYQSSLLNKVSQLENAFEKILKNVSRKNISLQPALELLFYSLLSCLSLDLKLIYFQTEALSSTQPVLKLNRIYLLNLLIKKQEILPIKCKLFLVGKKALIG